MEEEEEGDKDEVNGGTNCVVYGPTGLLIVDAPDADSLAVFMYTLDTEETYPITKPGVSTITSKVFDTVSYPVNRNP